MYTEMIIVIFHFSLHLTTMCLRYSPTIVACVCIHLACKWSNYKIPLSAQGKEWFSYVDSSATSELLESLTTEFLTIFERCPSRLKKKIMASTQAVSSLELLSWVLAHNFAFVAKLFNYDDNDDAFRSFPIFNPLIASGNFERVVLSEVWKVQTVQTQTLVGLEYGAAVISVGKKVS